ncbi:hypothetical protein E1B28_010457 [Marasmius oreades]|uniref:Uncharacterized protein n=1 Tax=Marasmius oreades TaxID=181124 RepID=A0A9P7RX72_9AGAR|nr:uncharacterized protein E1B28_010457 [Marasmius oreades]KAG7091421.1 hypothetical protein E1B28_010457 [Marasmius oreades]
MAPVVHAESSASRNEPNVGLIIGLVVAGIAILVCAVGVIIFIRRRRKSKATRQPSFADYVVDQEIEKLIGAPASKRQTPSFLPLPVPIMAYHDIHSQDPFDPYDTPAPSLYISMTEYRGISDSEGTGIPHKQSTTTFTPSIPVIASAKLSSFFQPLKEERRAPRASLSPRDLPPLVIPLSPKLRRIPTSPTLSTSAAITQRSSPVQPLVHSKSPSSDTGSAYSQASACTQIYQGFDHKEILPPVPPLPAGISQRPIQGEERADDDNDETLHRDRAPTPVIVGLLKTRARNSAMLRQLSRVSRIERSGSIVSYDGQSDEAIVLPSRGRSTKRRRRFERSEKEFQAEDSVLPIVFIPNPFESAVSPPPDSPSSAVSSLPCEHFIPSYRIEVTKSQPFVLQQVQPLKFSRGTPRK